MRANEAKKISLEAAERAADMCPGTMTNIEKDIEEAAERGLSRIYYDGYLAYDLSKRLKDAGYVVIQVLNTKTRAKLTSVSWIP